ncbi:MAG: ATP-binding protein, partial [Xenococcus sp. (in: cyanobacteria)]
LFKDYTEAVKNAILAEQYEKSVLGLMTSAEHNFYYSLSLLALCDRGLGTGDWGLGNKKEPNHQQLKYLEQVVTNQQKMKLWADHAPMNFQHKYDLIEAERARVLEEYWQASELYERAIQGARDNEYLHEEAIAYELAAEFYLTVGREKIAETYIREVHYGYVRWQCQAKIGDLEQRYPQFLSQPSIPQAQKISSSISSSSSTSSTLLDLASVLKASQAISGEIILENLLAKLMKIVIESAGATRGVLILPVQSKVEMGQVAAEPANKWVIEALGTVESDKVEVLKSIPLENVNGNSDNPLVCQAIVNYVIRTQVNLVLGNAPMNKKFNRNSYICKQKPKSILCTPLVDRAKLVGLLYLENNLATNAFTTDRIELLNLLSSQIAISIENAKLYSELQSNQKTLTQFLEAMPVGVGVLDATGKPYYLNQTAENIIGQGVINTDSEQLSSTYQVYQAGSDRIYPTQELPAIRALQGEQVTKDDLEIHRDDRIIPLEVSGTPIYDRDNNITYGLITFQDISQRQKTEKLLTDYNRTLEQEVSDRTQQLSQALANLQAAQDELIQSEKMAALGQLIAGVAHEINTPLGAIRASIDNISTALAKTLQQLPQLLQQLSPQQQTDFLALLAASRNSQSNISFREERKLKRSLRKDLTAKGIENPDAIATILVKMGITQNIEPFLILLNSPSNTSILECAYNLSLQQNNSDNIKLAVERAAKIVFALKSYARQDNSGHMTKAKISDGIDVVLTLYHNQLKQGIEVIKNYELVPEILCYPEELNQVWTNLIHNAIQAMGDRGKLNIAVTEQNNGVLVQITDSGSGIPAEIKDKIFIPFFTTKPAGEGTGLGLDIVSKIIDKHRGTIEVTSEPGNTVFSIWLAVSLLRE